MCVSSDAVDLDNADRLRQDVARTGRLNGPDEHAARRTSRQPVCAKVIDYRSLAGRTASAHRRLIRPDRGSQRIRVTGTS
jgi:hypothetical protein